LVGNGRDQQWSTDTIDWRQPIAVPAWLSRQAYIAIISQLYHGELATVEACRRLQAGALGGDPQIRACLEIQIGDETRHADVYRAYLSRLGDITPLQPELAALLERGHRWSDSDLGAILAYHVLLEGEALQIQHGFVTWLPCPLFRALNARIVVDEARHVGFGRVILPTRLAEMSAEERRSLLVWVKDLWQECAVAVMERYRIPSIMTARVCRRWLESRWRRQLRNLAAVGLIDSENTEGLESAGGLSRFK